jgi:PDZ domain/Aspartyl protease
MRLKQRQLKFYAVAFWIVWCSAACAIEPWTPEKILASVRLSAPGEPICVPARVGDRETLLLFDTGTSHTILDPVLLKNASPSVKRVEVDAGRSNTTLALYRAPRMEIAGIACDWIEEVLADDLGLFREATGAKFYGVLGMDFISRFVIHIDVDNRLLLVCSPESAANAPGVSVPVHFNRVGCPTIDVRLGNEPAVPFTVDTGCLGTGRMNVELQRALIHSRKARSTGIAPFSTDASKNETSVSQVRCSSAAIGEVANENLVFNLSGANVLGLYYLCRYRTTFDFPRGVVKVSPGDMRDLLDRQDYLGLVLKRAERGGLAIDAVVADSVASKAGFKANDELTAINGKRIEDLSLATIGRLLGFMTKEDIVFTVRRDQTMSTVLVPGG